MSDVIGGEAARNAERARSESRAADEELRAALRRATQAKHAVVAALWAEVETLEDAKAEAEAALAEL